MSCHVRFHVMFDFMSWSCWNVVCMMLHLRHCVPMCDVIDTTIYYMISYSCSIFSFLQVGNKADLVDEKQVTSEVASVNDINMLYYMFPVMSHIIGWSFSCHHDMMWYATICCSDDMRYMSCHAMWSHLSIHLSMSLCVVVAFCWKISYPLSRNFC